MSEPIAHLIDDDEAVRVSLAFALEMNDLPAKAYASAIDFLQIADTLDARTVEVYRANVMSKTKANGLSDLVRIALRAGL